jgi:hypothetical protein
VHGLDRDAVDSRLDLGESPEGLERPNGGAPWELGCVDEATNLSNTPMHVVSWRLNSDVQRTDAVSLHTFDDDLDVAEAELLRNRAECLLRGAGVE